MKKLLTFLGAVGVSVSAILVRWSTAPSLVLVLYRSTIASLILTPYVLARHRQELRRLTRREVLLCLASGVFLGLHFAAYFESLRHTTIAAAVVLVDTEVFFVALGSVLFLRQRLTRRAWTPLPSPSWAASWWRQPVRGAAETPCGATCWPSPALCL